MSATMWTSKLGNKYPMSEIQQNDSSAQRELKRLRGLRGNTLCADCGRQDTTWASVTHGVFICVTCSDVHRSVGTHITKVKGCTGTYLWGPDELQRMQTAGNLHADDVYGAEKVDPCASKETKQRFLVEKYEKRSLVGKSAGVQGKTEKVDRASTATQERSPAVRKPEPVSGHVKTALNQPVQRTTQTKTNTICVARETKIPDSLFDDFFNEAEDSYLSSPALVKASIAEPADGSLDAFLNTTLSIKLEQDVVNHTGYTGGLDPFQKKVHTTALSDDVFADWPEF